MSRVFPGRWGSAASPHGQASPRPLPLSLPGVPPQDCCRGKRDGVGSLERRPKRRLERDGHASERWDRVRRTRAPRRKRVRRGRPEDTDSVLAESVRGCEPARSSGSHPPPSDTSCSEQEDSEGEEAICPAVSCLQPEGDEVSEIWAVEDARPLTQEPRELGLASARSASCSELIRMAARAPRPQLMLLSPSLLGLLPFLEETLTLPFSPFPAPPASTAPALRRWEGCRCGARCLPQGGAVSTPKQSRLEGRL